METELGFVGDLQVVKKTPMGYILENGIEIEDTFAEMFTLMAMSPAKSPFSVLGFQWTQISPYLGS